MKENGIELNLSQVCYLVGGGSNALGNVETFWSFIVNKYFFILIKVCLHINYYNIVFTSILFHSQ